MKTVSFALMFALVSLAAKAQNVAPVAVESELGDALGIQAYKFEVTLKANEAMLVHCHAIKDWPNLAVPQDGWSGSSRMIINGKAL